MPKILIIEDNDESRDSLTGRLQCRGFSVVVAADGKTGVALALAEKPDLILMDMNMPEMDGFEAAREIKATPEGANLPIIAMAEDALPDHRERAFEVGCADSHNKPIELNTLITQIETILQRIPTPEVPSLAPAGSLVARVDVSSG